MKRRYVFLALAAMAAIAFVWSWQPTSEPTELYRHQRRGSITHGSQLGATVGAEWQAADQALRSRFRPSYVLWQSGPPEQIRRGGGLSDGPVLRGYAEVSYRDQSWRNGVVTLELMEGRVTKISWHYSGPFYIDL